MSDIAREIAELRDLALAMPGNAAMMRALLALLDRAPDSAIVSETLARFEADTYSDELREEAADLLVRAEHSGLAARWRVPPPVRGDGAPGNVVPLFEDDDEEAAAPAPVRPTIGFDDIGGLENVKKQIRRKIIAPFRDEGLFRRFKRKAGGGVLMYGPPGCGKTMLARAVAHECDAKFIEVHASQILDKYIGVPEQRIGGLFADARRSRPAILFFDEIEALAQKRQFSSREHVNTLVSVLLAEMDGFENNDGLLLLGATNIPWSIDSAFRRPGRFDRTVFVPPPDRTARRFILRGLMEGKPVAGGLDLAKIVARTSGYSGADLAAIVETATDYAIEASRSETDFEPISAAHFDEALADVRPSTGEWLSQARNFAEYANEDRLYDDLQDFLKKHAR